MLGIYFLFLSFIVGHIICSLAFPNLHLLSRQTYKGRNVEISKLFLLFPSWFLLGTLCLTWTTYIMAYSFRSSGSPLGYANGVVLIFYTILCGLYYIKKRRGLHIKEHYKKIGIRKGEIIYLFLITFLAIFLMWYTFYMTGDKIHVGYTVYSDFSPHIGMIRSFSQGGNFPTQYAFFAGEDIRYHFMFFFLVGNLEFLGLRLDFALNLPSVFSLLSTYLLLYVLAVKITGKQGGGYLTALFFTFRSSKSFFTYLLTIPKGSNIIETMAENTEFIGSTPREEWGLWNLNVYCNQRHFPFSLSVLLLILILFLPHLYKMFANIKDTNKKLKKEQYMLKQDITKENAVKKVNKDKKGYYYIKTLFFTREGWCVNNYKLAIIGGIVVGSTAFWNGASLIALLSILFVLAIFSAYRLEFLITALTATALSFLQSAFFVEGSPVSPELYFGFIVENPNLFRIINYLITLLGVLPFILLAAFFMKKGIDKYIMIAFLAPLCIAFTLSLTPDVTVNHKYIMITIMLLGIFAGDFIVSLYRLKGILTKLVCIILVVLLTITGVYDFTTLLRSNKDRIQLDENHNQTEWVKENADSKDIFLSPPYALNHLVLGGAMLYHGWPYFAWSAGYDTNGRDEQVKLMYEASTPRELDDLVKENKIRYIIVEYDNRNSENYELNEENIINSYQCVYEEGTGEEKFSIYDTKSPIFIQ